MPCILTWPSSLVGGNGRTSRLVITVYRILEVLAAHYVALHLDGKHVRMLYQLWRLVQECRLWEKYRDALLGMQLHYHV